MNDEFYSQQDRKAFERPKRERIGRTDDWDNYYSHDIYTFDLIRSILKGSVGQKWNDVYSKLKNDPRFDLWFNHYNIDHVVDLDVVFRNGKYYSSRFGYGGVQHEVSGPWVHPTTNILHYKPRNRYKYVPKPDPDFKKLDEYTCLERIWGIWYKIYFQPPSDWKRPIYGEFARFPYHLKKVHEWRRENAGLWSLCKFTKTQLNTKDKKKHNIV